MSGLVAVYGAGYSPFQLRHAPLVLALCTVQQDLEVGVFLAEFLHGIERRPLRELALQLRNLNLKLQGDMLSP